MKKPYSIKLGFVVLLIFAFSGRVHADRAEQEMYDGQLYKTGYSITPSRLERAVLFYDKSKAAYAEAKSGKTDFPVAIGKNASDVISLLSNFIYEERRGIFQDCQDKDCDDKIFEQINGLSVEELALEIAYSSYCFGTDPFVVASKICQESRFDAQAISPTKAVGLSQMTRSGIKEILDQMGHRGDAYYISEARGELKESIACYLENSSPRLFEKFPDIEVYSSGKTTKNYKSSTLHDVRNWLMVKKMSPESDKINIIRRQILFGQILLKIYLATSYNGRGTPDAKKLYENALQMYNGDTHKYNYAKQILIKSKKAAGLTKSL